MILEHIDELIEELSIYNRVQLAAANAQSTMSPRITMNPWDNKYEIGARAVQGLLTPAAKKLKEKFKRMKEKRKKKPVSIKRR
jgi:hypothetical protein